MSQKKFTRLEGCRIKCMRLTFETIMLIYQSKANLDEKILFGNIFHLVNSEIMEMLEKDLFGNKIPHSIMVHDLQAIEIKIYF